MNKFLEIAGDLRIAFYLLLSAAVIMWIGSLYAAENYTLINSLNGAKVHEWFLSAGLKNISAVWWIPAMFLVFLLLGINTVACTLRRILALTPKRKSMTGKKFMVLLSPSIIHLLFIFMLAGHFLGFAFIEYVKVPVSTGETVELPGAGNIKILSIEHDFYSSDTLMKNRIRQSRVKFMLAGTVGEGIFHIEFLKPVLTGGTMLQLEMEKKKREEIIVPSPENDTCNKEKNFHYQHAMSNETPQLFFSSTKDPGLFILLPGFIVVILLMGWYFYQTHFSRSTFTETEKEENFQ